MSCHLCRQRREDLVAAERRYLPWLQRTIQVENLKWFDKERYKEMSAEIERVQKWIDDTTAWLREHRCVVQPALFEDAASEPRETT